MNIDLKALLRPSSNWLYLFIPITLWLEHREVSAPLIFFAAAMAIIPIAQLIVHSTEKVAVHTGDAVGGLLNATFGNAPELIISFVALKAGLYDLVLGSLAGAVLANALFATGMAFLLGAFYAGVGGGLWAYYVRFVAIDQFTLIHSIWFIAMIIVGGMGSVTGALIGVFVIRLSQELITSIGPSLIERYPFFSGEIVFAAMNIFLGGMIAGFLILEPRGLMHRWNTLKRAYRLWPYPY